MGKIKFLSAFSCICLLVLGVAAKVSAQNTSAPMECINVKDFGAIGDGVNDDSGAIQAAIDAASVKGGIVFIPSGKYLITKSISVKPGVSVEGAATAPQYNELKGTVILATWGRDKEDADALFEMGSSTAVRGLTVYYPQQKAQDIHPYAWTFRLFDSDNTLENIVLINSYNAILVGGKQGMFGIGSEAFMDVPFAGAYSWMAALT
jgi:polygalacturonase